MLTPPTAFTISTTALKLTVTNSFTFKSKFVFNVLSANSAPPYEYACVILSKPFPGISK